MGLFEQIVTETQRKGLDFLVIGGHAVNFYGYSRESERIRRLFLKYGNLDLYEKIVCACSDD
ncbi:MAG: hypothetical protein ACLQM8_10185 [Limisphaerales bacterium]